MKNFVFVCILSFGLLGAQTTRPLEALPATAAFATWAVVSPLVSLLVNVVPNLLWIIGCLLVDQKDFASRYAMGGIVGGTVGTCAAVAVYRMFQQVQEKQKTLRLTNKL